MKKYKKLIESNFDKVKYFSYASPEDKKSLHCTITLPDEGQLSILVEKPTRVASLWFLAFNIRFSPIRLQRSDPNTGKINIFKPNDPFEDLQKLIIELKQIL